MKKNNGKVKKNIVKSKKINKKKIKKTNRKVTKKITMEEIYSIINKVQLKRKEISFSSLIEDAPVVENNIKDAELKYKKTELKTKVVFIIFPNEKRYDDDVDVLIDAMDDEIPDIDQIFG